MAGIRIGARIRREDLHGVPISSRDATQHGDAGTVMTPGNPEVGGTFVAPPSGRVRIVIGAEGFDVALSDNMHVSYELRLGTNNTGVIVEAADWPKGYATSDEATNWDKASWACLKTGLTPGASYYIRLMHRGATGAVNVNMRQIQVYPQP